MLWFFAFWLLRWDAVEQAQGCDHLLAGTVLAGFSSSPVSSESEIIMLSCTAVYLGTL